MTGHRVLVCGGRGYAGELVGQTLTYLRALFGPLTVIEGGARGADLLAGNWARSQPDGKLVTERAKWDALGRAAGHIRNQRMLDAHAPQIVLAFPGGYGTADMVARARRAGVPVVDFAD